MMLISNKSLRIYYLTIFAFCLIIGYVINTNNVISPTTENVILLFVKTSKGYDLKINGMDQYRNRLGFATKLQALLKSWEDKLFEIKRMPIQYAKWEENGGKNKSLNFKAKLQTSTEIQVKVDLHGRKIIRPKKILMYRRPNWLPLNPRDSSVNNNPEFKCEYIDMNLTTGGDISHIENIARNANAILIHSANTLNTTTLDSIYSNSSSEIGGNKKTGALKLIYFTLESPSYTRDSFVMNIQNKNRARDLLASFWRGSDIYTPFSRWHTLNTTTTNALPGKNYAAGRTKMAAIVVSNCQPSNNRMQFVNQLQKFITVDVFGKCGTIDCRQMDCFATIQKNYKFYLAFENSNCRDYITEKFYKNAYSNDLLPIALGAHPSDYKAVAPPNSYIHVEDFKSVESLGRYLLQLHQNDTLYNSYFKWKGSGTFNHGNRALREICAYLHTQDLTFEDIESASKSRIDKKLGENGKSKDILMPYFNTKDEYNFDRFHWNTQDDRLCLKHNEWYWNK